MSKYLLRFFLILLVVNSLSACRLMKVLKQPVRKHPVADTTSLKVAHVDTVAIKKAGADSIAAVQKRQLIAMLTPLWTKQVAFNTFSAKAKMHYEGPEKSFDFVAHIRIRKDSVIWINITASVLGIQAARVLITPDSVKWINYLEKDVTFMPMRQASQLLQVAIDFTLLQNFILGEPLRKSGSITDATALPTAWAMQVEDDSCIQRITYTLPDTTIANAQIAMRSNYSLHGITQFTNYYLIDSHKFSTNREANMQYAGKQYYLGINFQNAEFDKEVDFPFSIPRNFSISR